jgi:hypothetical protein
MCLPHSEIRHPDAIHYAICCGTWTSSCLYSLKYGQYINRKRFYIDWGIPSPLIDIFLNANITRLDMQQLLEFTFDTLLSTAAMIEINEYYKWKQVYIDVINGRQHIANKRFNEGYIFTLDRTHKIVLWRVNSSMGCNGLANVKPTADVLSYSSNCMLCHPLYLQLGNKFEVFLYNVTKFSLDETDKQFV